MNPFRRRGGPPGARFARVQDQLPIAWIGEHVVVLRARSAASSPTAARPPRSRTQRRATSANSVSRGSPAAASASEQAR